MENQSKKANDSLASSTISMLMSLVYLATICWVAPIAPMIIVWFFDMSFQSFAVIWVIGLPFFGATLYLFSKRESS